MRRADFKCDECGHVAEFDLSVVEALRKDIAGVMPLPFCGSTEHAYTAVPMRRVWSTFQIAWPMSKRGH